jgi:hypothetical protein
LAVIRTTIRSDSTRVPPVTADRSPPASRMTGADSPVIADSSTDAMPSTISPSEGIISPADTTTVIDGELRGRDPIDAPVEPTDVGHGAGPGLAQGRRLGLASPFGHGLGEVGEQHGEPQLRRHQSREDVLLARGVAEVLHAKAEPLLFPAEVKA